MIVMMVCVALIQLLVGTRKLGRRQELQGRPAAAEPAE
jgi:iron(III) transport system permease protein